MSLYRRDRRRSNPNKPHPQESEQPQRGIRRYQRRYRFTGWPVLGQRGSKSAHSWLRRSWVPAYFTLPWFESRGEVGAPAADDNTDQALEAESLHSD